jgi:hypothetical protein
VRWAGTDSIPARTVLLVLTRRVRGRVSRLATAPKAPTTTQQPVSLDRHFLRCCLRSPTAMGAAPMTLMAAAPTMMMAVVKTRIANAASVPHAPRVPAVLRTMTAPENSHVVTQAAVLGAPGTRIAVSGNQSSRGDTHRYSAKPVQLARQMSPLTRKPPRQSSKVRSP